MSGMTFEPGDVVLVPFPYTDLSSKKVRPALVLSRPLNHGADLVVCAITSRVANMEHSVLIEPADMESGELRRASRAKLGKLVTISVGVVRRRIGRVQEAVLYQARKELRAVLAI